MLSPELKKLKESLEEKDAPFASERRLLEELEILDKIDTPLC